MNAGFELSEGLCSMRLYQGDLPVNAGYAILQAPSTSMVR